MDAEKKKRAENIIGLILVVLTVVSAVIKVQMEIDNDEMYVVAMGMRMLQGDRLFADMWDLHMTSAWSAYLGLLLFRSVTGGLDGAVLFLRSLSVAAQFAVALGAYRILRRWNPRSAAGAAALVLANLLPRASQNLEYGLLEMLFVSAAVLLLYDVMMREKEKETVRGSRIRILAAGICFSLGVLAYPTVLVAFPVLLVALCLLSPASGRRWKIPALFAGTCAVCACVFLGFLMTYLTPQQFLSSLQGMLMDGSHAGVDKTASYPGQLAVIGERAVLIAAFAAVIVGCYVIASRVIEKREAGDKKILFAGAILLAGALVIIGLNVTGLRPSSPIGLQTRYLMAAGAALYAALRYRDRMVLGLYVLPGIAIYAGAMIGSNLGFEENAAYLYLAAVAAVLLLVRGAEDASHTGDTQAKGFVLVCAACYIASLIFCRGYLVRITNTEPANITEQRVRVESGLLGGLYLYPDEASELAEKENEIRQYTGEEDVMLYIGVQPICNLFSNGRFTAATCISTPVYDEEWILYYEDAAHASPTVLFVDKDTYETWQDFEETPFGAYLIDRRGLTMERVTESESFFVVSGIK